jgi:hypothetical protein
MTYFQNDTQAAGYDESAKKFYIWFETEGKEETIEYDTLGELCEGLISYEIESEVEALLPMLEGEFKFSNLGRVEKDGLEFGGIDIDGDFRPYFEGAKKYESEIWEFVKTYVTEAIEGDYGNPTQELLKFTGQINEYRWKHRYGWVKN